MNRGNQVLAGLLVLQIVLAVVVLWPRQQAIAAGDPLLPELDADQVTGLTVRDGEGGIVRLVKRGDAWVLADAGDYPATVGTVPGVLAKIAALNDGRLVAETQDSHARLEVAGDQYVSKVELELQDGSVHTLYLGSSPSYGAAHVRVEGQDQVYLASDLSDQDVATRLSAWIDTSYFSVPSDQIVAATLENKNGVFEFSKEGQEWTVADLDEDETASSANLSALISRATSVRMLRPLGKEPSDEYGMQEPSAELVLYARSPEGTETTYTLAVGAQDADGSYVLKASESPYYVQVSEFTAQDWVENGREDFLELPPTPTSSE
jgi:hypothetical protein